MTDFSIIFHISCPKCRLQCIQRTKDRLTVGDLYLRGIRMRVQFLDVECVKHTSVGMRKDYVGQPPVQHFGGRDLPKPWEFNAELPPFWNNNGDVFR